MGDSSWLNQFDIQKTSGFRVTVGIEPDLENPSADLYFDDEAVAIITQERKTGDFEIEFLSTKNIASRRFSLADFEKSLAEAISRLRRFG